MNRTIAIGDVHGCAHELVELLNAINLRETDQIVFLGDLVNNGPLSHEVVKIARQIGAVALLGNHERRLLWYRRTGKSRALRRMDLVTLNSLTRKDWNYLERMPLTYQVEQGQTVLVHGGFDPGSFWASQPASVVTEIQYLGGVVAKTKNQRVHWSERWEGPPFVVYGHTPRPAVKRTAHTLGIDTGCYQGGHLTAAILPELELVQVKARRKYA